MRASVLLVCWIVIGRGRQDPTTQGCNPLQDLALILLAAQPSSGFQPLPEHMKCSTVRGALASWGPRHCRGCVTKESPRNRVASSPVMLTMGGEQITPVVPESIERPTVGDVVTILRTRNTEEWCPQIIGSKLPIVTDGRDYRPYQVEGSTTWLDAGDVQATGEKRKVLPKRDFSHLRNKDELEEKIDEAVRSNTPLVIVFFARFCRTCRAAKPKLKRKIGKWTDVEFCDVLYDENRELAMSLGIETMPYVLIFAGNKGKVSQFPCGPSKVYKIDEQLAIHLK